MLKLLLKLLRTFYNEESPGPKAPRQINAEGKELVKKYEGLKLEAYKDSVGVNTIGYGHTGDVTMGQTITREQAELLLEWDLMGFERGVTNLVKKDINDNQFSALVSFAYNLGLGRLEKSSLLRFVNAGEKLAAAEEFSKWVNAGGVKLAGLVSRRQAEKELFLK